MELVESYMLPLISLVTSKPICDSLMRYKGIFPYILSIIPYRTRVLLICC